MRYLFCLCLLLLLPACGYLPPLPLLGESGQEAPPTLADLQPLPADDRREALPAATLAELESAYLSVLTVADDPAVRLQVRRRLADLQLMTTEVEAASESVDQASYQHAIAAYRGLLEEYPEAAAGDQLLYQMARAHDLSGQGEEAVALMIQISEEYPQSRHATEAHFRRGDAYFSAGRYPQAAQAYQQVVEAGPNDEYYANSLYMLGWSYFKQERYDLAVTAYTATLDSVLLQGSGMTGLARGDREMAQDCLRVLAVIFDTRGGPQAIVQAFALSGPRTYQPLVYAALGELYLEQERYQDSADTYAGFIRAHPLALEAPTFQNDIIAVYETAGFPQRVISGKKDYVAAYGVAGRYWQTADLDQRASLQPDLKRYIDELARHYHALAQQADAATVQANYLLAAYYYALYVDSFPEDPQVPDTLFLLAESREAAGQYRLAIDAYQRMAYEYSTHPQAADAGYAAILAQASLAAPGPDDHMDLIAMQLGFAGTFDEDPRAPNVLANAAGALLAADLYEGADAAAATLLAWQPTPKAGVLVPAWLIRGHAAFELADYQRAEQSYQSALALISVNDERREQTLESLAAAIYRQGERAAAQEDYALAASHFSRVMSASPESGVRVAAQYDAASNYFLAGDATRGADLLRDFRNRYPDHALSGNIGPRLVQHYETQGQWGEAAAELDLISQNSDNPAMQREALYLAAAYYQRAGMTEQAIARYRDYAHQWRQPIAPRMEAMLALSDLYAQQKKPDKRHYWLAALANAYDTAGDEADDRSRYLAARATSELADEDYRQFLEVTLQAPLTQNLRRKREAMDRTLAGYQRVNAYGVQEFGTRATYRMGQVYRELSRALLASPRPQGLDALALEQYEILLEEQAWPFEEKAVSIHETNAQRAWEGLFDPWIEQSFSALAQLMPARWGKREQTVTSIEEIR